MQYTIDATHKSIGRLASEIAGILQGKRTAAYNPRLPGDDAVYVQNIAQLFVTRKKMTQKKYYKHTGPPGHLKERSLKDVLAKKPAWALREAVRRMLPNNRLRAKRLRRLIVE